MEKGPMIKPKIPNQEPMEFNIVGTPCSFTINRTAEFIDDPTKEKAGE